MATHRPVRCFLSGGNNYIIFDIACYSKIEFITLTYSYKA